MNNHKNDLLKIIAIISMTLDHIGWLFFPDIIIFRVAGRLAFPIFAYQIALGYEKTKNVYQYMLRLFIFGLISQIPYSLLTEGLNIFFTLLIGLVMIYLKDKTNIFIGLLPLVFDYFFELEYGIYGLLMIYCFSIFKDNKANAILSIISLTLVFSSLYYHNLVQALAIFALPMIFYEFKTRITLNKYVFYLYYPLHLLLLKFILSA